MIPDPAFADDRLPTGGTMLSRIILVFLALFLALPAQARWYEASSDNFVIYADDSEADVHTFAQNLERYHSALKFITGRDVPVPSPSNRVTIFVVGGQGEIEDLVGEGRSTVAGFYVPRAGGSRAFVQDIRAKSGYPSFSTVVLLHEYAHHFFIAASPHAMPRWLSEGVAEFFASTTFKDDGGMMVGRPAQHRADEIAFADKVSVAELLDHELYEAKRGRRYDAFYGTSWALVHYLMFDEGRIGQLNAYWRRVSEGESSTEAARAAFGDLEQLQKDLDRYLRQRRMMTYNLAPGQLPVGRIAMRPLREGEAAIMPVRFVSQRGVSREQALELLPKARKIAERFPNDAAVLAALAEAEHDAGNDAEAVAAADRAIALDPGQANAYVQKGYALFRLANDTEGAGRDDAFKAAMVPFTALNAIENDHPLPLIYYYRSFTDRGLEPNETARHALENAAKFAPFDQDLAMRVAMMQAQEGSILLARRTLSPVAANPHGGRRAEAAKALRTLLADAPEGTPWRTRETDIAAMIASDAGDDSRTDGEKDGGDE